MVKQKKTKEIDQTKLFDYGFTSNKLHDALKSLDRRISPSQTSVYTHGLHPYVAKFMPHFPNLFINLFSQRNETVLDPMCGSGTTLVESLLNGRNAVGVDIDPLARLISSVATSKVSKNIEKWLAIYIPMIIATKEINSLMNPL